MSDFFTALRNRFLSAAEPERATAMSAYMRDQFPFFGIPAPRRKELIRDLLKEYGFPAEESWAPLGQECFAQNQAREIQYAYIDLMTRRAKKMNPDWLPYWEEKITTLSWWDTVDGICPNITGTILLRHPEYMESTTAKWIASENIWMQRSALIFQLRYKNEVREDLLFRYIKERADSQEFFVQKAAGWALREYSKYQPAAVIRFLQAEQVSPLSFREGIKVLKKKGQWPA